MANQKKLIIANWKMNPRTMREAKRLFAAIKKTGNILQHVQTVVCPPALYLSELQKIVSGHRVVLGAQDAFFEREGAYTGEISPLQLKKAGIQYVIAGHSERRALGETNETVNKKTSAALKEGLHVVVCVGERQRDEHANYLHALREEIQESLKGISQSSLLRLVVAYEPVWAVGASARSADKPEDTQEMVLFIRKVLTEMFSRKHALSVPIVYGGSVHKKNAQDFLLHAGVDGLLIGRASLNAGEFSDILNTAKRAP